MTPQTPAPQPVAPPTPELSAREFFNQDDAALSQAIGLDISAPTEEVESELPSDAPAPVPAPPKPGAEKEEAPSDEVIIPPVQRKLMTEFRVVDTEGELEIPDIKIKFKAKGEERELPLDHVVRLAQFGFANEEREQQVLASKQFVSEAQQEIENHRQAIQRYESYYERMFNDPAFYEEARLAFLNQNTPEARALRAEQELQRERAEKAQTQEHQHLANFVQTVLTPAVSRLMTENPLVSEQEVIGQYTKLTAPLLRNGRVPPNRFAEVERIVAGDLASWVQQVQYERDLGKRQAEQKNAQATQKLAATKRQVGRVFSQAGAVAEQTQKPTKFDSAQDWLKATLPLPSE